MYLACLGAIVLGFAKAGFKGLGILVVTLFTLNFPARASVGIVLPLLVLADILAVSYYRRDVDWKTLKILLPWMVFGVLVGVVTGKYLDEKLFKQMLGLIIIISGLMMLWFDRKDDEYVPKSKGFGITMGFGAGFTTMVGNLAGAFSNLYFLAMRFPKNLFIGTAAYLFFVINIFKLPFHIWSWKTINQASLLIDLKLSAFVIIGFVVGLRLIRYLNDVQYKKYILYVTIIGGILILFK